MTIVTAKVSFTVTAIVSAEKYVDHLGVPNSDFDAIRKIDIESIEFDGFMTRGNQADVEEYVIDLAEALPIDEWEPEE